jgi:heterotetrameric sarcosine oxidase gamma subunit
MAEPLAPFAGAFRPVDGPPGLWIEPRAGDGLALVQARRGQGPALIARILEDCGLAPADGPRCAFGPGAVFVGTAPGAWLAVREAGGFAWAEGLAARLAGLASVADQSGGYGLLRLGGPAAADVLAKGVFLDLHPKAFPQGAAAATVLAHVNVLLWRRPDGFELAIPRSSAGHVAHGLTASAVGLGVEVRQPAAPLA